MHQLIFLNGIRKFESFLPNLMINLKNKLIYYFCGLLELAGIFNILFTWLDKLVIMLVQTCSLLKG